MKAILGKKVGMTQIFSDNGEMIPVTVIEAGPAVVTQIKTVETDGYYGVQIGFEDQKVQRLNKPMKGHYDEDMSCDFAEEKPHRASLNDLVVEEVGDE